jgi:hypothetical protein
VEETYCLTVYKNPGEYHLRNFVILWRMCNLQYDYVCALTWCACVCVWMWVCMCICVSYEILNQYMDFH